jgi:CelD/BcsL family acetyltransferase involved in cellulose biosynthesis
MALSATPAIVLVSRKDGTPLMLVPMAERRQGTMRILEFIDFGICDYNAPVIRLDFATELAGQDFSVLWRQILGLVGRVDAVNLQKMPAMIGEAPNPFVQLTCQEDMVAFHCPLSGDFAGYMKSRGGHMSRELRRSRRKLDEVGSVELQVASDPEIAAAFIQSTISSKSAWCRANGVCDLLGQSAYTDFYNTLARQEVGGIAHASALMVGDRMIAGNFGLVWRGRFYGLIQSSDFENYRAYSPGNILLAELIRWCCENGISLFDFSIGSESYKGRWADDEQQLYQHGQAFSVKGRLVNVRRRALAGFKSRAHPQLVDALRSLRNKTGAPPQSW